VPTVQESVEKRVTLQDLYTSKIHETSVSITSISATLPIQGQDPFEESSTVIQEISVLVLHTCLSTGATDFDL